MASCGAAFRWLVDTEILAPIRVDAEGPISFTLRRAIHVENTLASPGAIKLLGGFNYELAIGGREGFS